MTTSIAVRPEEQYAFGGGDKALRKIDSPTMHWSGPVDDNSVAFGTVFQRYNSGDAVVRHRHTFEQLRYIISGSMKYGQGAAHTATAGDCVYFPESVSYGPTTYETGEMFLLQWRGPSELGAYIPVEELNDAMEQMRQVGRFEHDNGGIFRYNDGRARDSHEATVEFITGKPATYAPPRYGDQLLVRGGHFPRRDVVGAPGVQIRHLGCFSDVGPNVKLLNFEADSTLTVKGAQSQQVWALVKGAVRAGNKVLEAHSVLYFPIGADPATVTAVDGPAEVLVTHLRKDGVTEMNSSEF